MKVIKSYETKFNHYRIVLKIREYKYYAQIFDKTIGWHDILNGDRSTIEECEDIIMSAYHRECSYLTKFPNN